MPIIAGQEDKPDRFPLDRLDLLTHRERRVLQLRYGLLDGNVRTSAEVGRLLRIGLQTVRHTELKALQKLQGSGLPGDWRTLASGD